MRRHGASDASRQGSGDRASLPVRTSVMRGKWMVIQATLGVLLVLVRACGGATTQATTAGLRYEATTELGTSSVLGLGAGPTVLATLVITNVGDTTQRISWSDCYTGGPVWLRAYQVNGDRKLVWDANRAFADLYCDLVGHYRDVQPGAHWQFTLPVPVRKILGDSLPNGSYSFTVSAAALEPVNANELPAGQLVLVR